MNSAPVNLAFRLTRTRRPVPSKEEEKGRTERPILHCSMVENSLILDRFGRNLVNVDFRQVHVGNRSAFRRGHVTANSDSQQKSKAHLKTSRRQWGLNEPVYISRRGGHACACTHTHTRSISSQPVKGRMPIPVAIKIADNHGRGY